MRAKLRRKWWGRTAAFAMVAILATACGSVVPKDAFRTAAQRGEDGGLSIGSGPGGLSPSTGGPLPTEASGPLGGSTTGPNAPAGPLGNLPAAVGPGITATTISFGAGYNVNQGAANAGIGGGGAGGSDIRDAYNVMIDQINQQGGIAGRKLVPIYYGYDAASSQTVDQQAQAACSRWTQDHKVFLMLAGQFPVERECAKRAGAVEYWAPAGSNSVPDTFQQYPHYLEITGLNIVRLGPVTIAGLLRQGYFTKGARIGIVAWDDPAYHQAVDQGFLPALRAHGLKVATQPFYVHAPENVQDLAGGSADVNSAVLRFSTQRIDHVMLLDGPVGVCGGACLGFLFLNRAKAQHYQPTYGFNDNNLPVDALDSGLYPPDQLRGSLVVSWGDDAKSKDAGWRPNPGRQRCEALMKEHGVDMGSVNAHSAAIEACDEMWFLQAIVAKIGRATLTVDSFIAGANALGRSFVSPSAYGTHFSPTQHDGIAAARNMQFVTSCKCFQYTTDPYQV